LVQPPFSKVEGSKTEDFLSYNGLVEFLDVTCQSYQETNSEGEVLAFDLQLVLHYSMYLSTV